MPLPCFPYDILDYTVEILLQTNHKTELFAMSLTCRSMVSVCQKRLFSKMTLAPRTWDKRKIRDFTPIELPKQLREKVLAMEAVEHLAERSPHILSYVRTLDFISHQSNHEEEGLSSILLKFDGLQYLSIEVYEQLEDWEEPYSWNSFPQRYQLVLSQLIRRTSLRSLTLVGLRDIPLSILITCRHLNALSLAYCNLPSNSSVLEPILHMSVGPLPLRELTISHSGMGFMPLLYQDPLYSHPIIDPTTLETLELVTSSLGWSNGSWNRDVFEQVSNLKTLRIRDAYLNRSESLSGVLRSLHPNSHTSLVDFEFEIIYGYQPLRNSDSLANSMLRDLKLPSLKRLKLYIRDIDSGVPEAAATLLLEEFKKLDLIIGGPHFPSLKEVYIQVGMVYAIPGPQIKRCQLARDTHFPRISSKLSIEFNYKFF